ncbi:type II toxin-antitoxin system prevent-host-death family antitoxin [Pontibacterium sp. N1Y112]|uniref:Antitoxin n=1 Tax=Pontibacterium sinense TaxID=2781979 RepID=A0A8J7K6M6_9GAMM|nr:type II toxin-antitoxin system prevent-host-death family antitoxin [Pontibacterium sinense]MBE9398705.1 type II toxin-antitoxin system prevent-host-death family antitoxin [Pontibacterium sinense]
MELTATEAKREFGDLILKAQSEAVRISRNGKPVAAVISHEEFEQYQAFKEQQLKAAIEEGMADLEAGRIHDGESVFEELRKLAK